MDLYHFTVARDYLDVVNGFPFSSSLVAANASYSASDLSGLSDKSIDQLLETNTQIVVSTTVAYVSVSLVGFDGLGLNNTGLVFGPDYVIICLFISSRKSRGVYPCSNVKGIFQALH